MKNKDPVGLLAGWFAGRGCLDVRVVSKEKKIACGIPFGVGDVSSNY